MLKCYTFNTVNLIALFSLMLYIHTKRKKAEGVVLAFLYWKENLKYPSLKFKIILIWLSENSRNVDLLATFNL